MDVEFLELGFDLSEYASRNQHADDYTCKLPEAPVGDDPEEWNAFGREYAAARVATDEILQKFNGERKVWSGLSGKLATHTKNGKLPVAKNFVKKAGK